jgi:tetratricopeptide (TPR) repeat protein
VILVVVAHLMAMTAIAATDEPAAAALPPAVLENIRDGNFTKALGQLTSLEAPERTEQSANIERLSYIVALLDLARTNVHDGHKAAAEAILSQLSDAVVDPAALTFKEGLARRSARLRHQMRIRERASSRRALERAAALRAAGDVDGASTIYDQLLAAPDEHAATVVAKAHAAKHAMALEKVGWRHAIGESLGGLRTIGEWIVALGLLAGLLRLLAYGLRCFPRDTPSVSIDETGAAADQKALATSEIVERLLSVDPDGHGAAVDAIEDLDRSGLSNVSLATQDVDGLQEIASSADRVSIAGLSFTPQQVYALLRPLRRPFAREYTGSLTQTADGRSRLALTLRANGSTTWCTIDSPARAETIAEAADYIAFTAAQWRLSDNWASFRSYRKATRLVRAAGSSPSEETWAAARDLFETALECDPENVAAQYRLGVLQRKLGRNAEAAATLERLATTLDAPQPSKRLSEFLRRNPELRTTVRYDLALCFAKQDRTSAVDRAESIFRSLASRPRPGAVPTPPPTAGQPNVPERFVVLATGGIAAVLAARMALVERRAETESARRRWLDEIIAMGKLLDERRREGELSDARTASSALAVARAAEGRGRYLLGDLHQAEVALRAARAENPRLACAAVNLAQVCTKQAKADRPELVDEAIDLLQRALKLSPRNGKANFLLGCIYHYNRHDEENAVRHLQEARKWGRSEKADLVYAETLLVAAKVDDAIDVLDASLHAKDEPVDYRYELYLALLSDRPVPDAEHLGDFARRARFAQACVERLERSNVRTTIKEKCRRFLAQILDKLPKQQAATQID